MNQIARAHLAKSHLTYVLHSTPQELVSQSWEVKGGDSKQGACEELVHGCPGCLNHQASAALGSVNRLLPTLVNDGTEATVAPPFSKTTQT